MSGSFCLKSRKLAIILAMRATAVRLLLKQRRSGAPPCPSEFRRFAHRPKRYLFRRPRALRGRAVVHRTRTEVSALRVPSLTRPALALLVTFRDNAASAASVKDPLRLHAPQMIKQIDNSNGSVAMAQIVAYHTLRSRSETAPIFTNHVSFRSLAEEIIARHSHSSLRAIHSGNLYAPSLLNLHTNARGPVSVPILFPLFTRILAGASTPFDFETFIACKRADDAPHP